MGGGEARAKSLVGLGGGGQPAEAAARDGGEVGPDVVVTEPEDADPEGGAAQRDAGSIARRMTLSPTASPAGSPASFISNSGAWCGAGRPWEGRIPTRK